MVSTKTAKEATSTYNIDDPPVRVKQLSVAPHLLFAMTGKAPVRVKQLSVAPHLLFAMTGKAPVRVKQLSVAPHLLFAMTGKVMTGYQSIGAE